MTPLPTLGFVGLGEMGGPMARNLLAAGYALIGYDLDGERLAGAADAGAMIGDSPADVVAKCDVILTSLPSSGSFVQVAEQEILPSVRSGQIMIDFGTVSSPETRRLAALFAEKGVDLLDVPVSGGGGGAQRAKLFMFAGGKKETVERCRPILETVGGSEDLTYCGPAGAGQAVKGVNQLMMGLGNALTEHFIVENGEVFTDRMARYRIPSITQTPEIISIVVEHPTLEGPFGAKGIGEIVSIPTTPAITNAIYNAVGVRIDRLPVDQEEIVRQFIEMEG